jgi:hypothetical protein
MDSLKKTEYERVKVLSKIIMNLTNNLRPGNLFPTMTTITFRPESHTCPQCETRMKVLKTKTKSVATLPIGQFLAREFIYHCVRCRLTVGSEELTGLVPSGCNIGYDVLVYVGKAFFQESLDNKQIVENLREKNINVCRSEISYLAKKFIIYMALLHKKVQSKTRDFLSMNGGYILHLDGTHEGESPHLISVLDGITEIVLDNIKLPSENANDLIPFLENIKSAYGNPVAVVSDMGKGILVAIKEVFKNIPMFICHYHFLKSVGKEFFWEEYDTIRKRLKKYGIQGTLRKKVRTLKQNNITTHPQLVELFINGIDTEDAAKVRTLEGLPYMVVHTLLMWALEGKNQGQGRGFPFDQPHLIFYQRLVIVYTLLDQLSKAGLFKSTKEKKLYKTIRHDLQVITRDSVLKRVSTKIQEKLTVFNRLRLAMRITLPENKRGLNDSGEPFNMKMIEKEVKKFRKRLSKDKNCMNDKAYQKIISQIDKYWEMLFCDPIIVETKVGKIIIQPQRTNNILEQFFRVLMRTYRKKNGFQAMERTLKAMLKDTPLVMNLKNKDYMDILLGGKGDLAQRFADIDLKTVQQQMKKSDENKYPISAKLKRIVNAPTFPESLTSLMDKNIS